MRLQKNKKAQYQYRWIIFFVFILFTLPLAMYGLKYLFLPVKTVTAQINSAGKIIDKTYDPDNAIYNYEWFKTQYEKIGAIRKQIEQQKLQIAEFKELYGNDANKWQEDSRLEYSRLTSIKSGLINQESNLVADYNARAKMVNRAIFQDKLPLSVDKMLW